MNRLLRLTPLAAQRCPFHGVTNHQTNYSRRPHPSWLTIALAVTTVAAMLFIAPRARSQLVADGATATLANVITNVGDFLTVGTNGANTLLIVTNAASVFNLLEGFIGFNPGANNNQITVTGTNSLWSSANYLNVGYYGSFNKLVIENGGRVTDRVGFLGRNFNANNNQITVTGPGSAWFTSGDLYLGGSGPFNTLLISNGGQVEDYDGYVGAVTTANSNQITVTGPNSLWTTRTNLHIGLNSAGNTLLIADGGKVENHEGHVGMVSTASNNQITVTGPNSLWASRTNLHIGQYSPGNTLLIAAGGQVADFEGLIGGDLAANNNHLTVTGPNSVWTNGGKFLVGFASSGNTLLISDGGRVADLIGAIGFHSSGNNNQATVTGPNSVWTNSAELVVGFLGTFNSLLVTNGGYVANDIGAIGLSNANNQVIVTGSNSLWTNRGSLFVGDYGSFNTLLITGGGRVADNAGFVGTALNANNNLAIVNGPNSVWASSDSLYAGNSSSGNVLVVTNGGQVTATRGSLGDQGSASNNLVIVTGPNSVWTNSGNFSVGEYGSFNTLLITNGGRVADNVGYLGGNPKGSNNQVIVTGASSAWTNSDRLSIGNFSSGNRLLVANGGWVADNFGYLGDSTNADNNQVTVTGFNSVWTNRSSFFLGYDGSSNRLIVTNGGRVADNIGYLGVNPAASNNQVTITGLNSIWTNSGNLFVGSNSSFNTLLIASGGRVADNVGYLGNNSNANNNQIIVTGPNSLWTNRGDLYLGNFGSFNTLLITNGGRVADNAPGIGIESSARNNKVIVTDPNSVWNNSASLYVGERGSGSLVLITNGGLIANDRGYLGYYAGGSNNQVTVTGFNSLWTSGGALFVGYGGSFNSLLIANGGRVANNAGTIGDDATANNNQVTVTGTNAVWNSGSILYVGYSGSSNTLLIADGGVVTSSACDIGLNVGANNNHVIVSGPTSMWSNNGDLYSGYSGSGNTLLLTNGGALQSVTVYVGFNASSANNLFTVENGALTVTNAGGTGTLDVRRGNAVFSGGTVTADRLLLTNGASSIFTFNGGTLVLRNSTVKNGVPLVVGNGSSAATCRLSGNGLHSFDNGLTIANNAQLAGSGTIAGVLTVQSGGSLSVGDSVGRLVLSNSPTWQGNLLMEISKPNVSTFTNDQIEVAAGLTYGGTLTVTHLGPTALSAGNTIPLFNATSYGGAFTSVTLPALDPGLMWTNRLLIDGSLAVVASMPPIISGFTQSGTNLVLNVTGGSPGGGYTLLTSTNVALPLSNWTTNSTGNFDGLGNVTVTNAINQATPQRCFTVRTP